jgi:hypothetical protein
MIALTMAGRFPVETPSGVSAIAPALGVGTQNEERNK